MTFAPNKLKELRESNQISQEDLIYELRNRGLKISRQTLYQWENSTTQPRVNDLAVIAEYFKKPIKYFFT